MADINQTYLGASEQYDPDIVIARLPGVFPWSPSRELYLPDAERQKIRDQNAKAIQTADAVKVPYTGTTAMERKAWLNARIDAINERVKFIKSRTDTLLTTLQGYASNDYDVLTKAVTSALAFVPVVGSAAVLAQNQVTAGQSLEQFKLQTLIRDYANDLTQLGIIRASMIKELQAAPNTPIIPAITTPISNAPNIRTDYIIYIALGIALLVFIWYQKRR